MTMRNFTSTLAAVVLFALPACGGDAAKTDTKAKTVTKTDVKADAPKPDIKPEVATPEKPADATPPVNPADEKVQLAATVAKEISGAPDKADEILGKHGLDRDKLDAMMFEIAGDPEMTRAYMAARRDS